MYGNTHHTADDLKNWLFSHFNKQNEINYTHSDKYIAAAFSRLYSNVSRDMLVEAMILAGFRAEKVGDAYCFNITDDSPAFAQLDAMFE